MMSLQDVHLKKAGRYQYVEEKTTYIMYAPVINTERLKYSIEVLIISF